MIVNGEECTPVNQSLFPCGCVLSVVEVNTGAHAGTFAVVVNACSETCERGQRLAERPS